MKDYREAYIRKAEIAQLVILHHLYSQSGSHDLIFQGGTALRWCYGASRFSEDLDFVTPLDVEAIGVLVDRTLKSVERAMVAHFGPGALSASQKSARKYTVKQFVNYLPATAREKISIKLEFEGIKNVRPVTKNYILSALPAVSYLLALGEFKVPRPNAVLVAETAEEILSDKVRALLERRYLKGRDIFDVWYLRSALHAFADKTTVERKMTMYAWPFTAMRGFDFFMNPTPKERNELRNAVKQDLTRFLPPEVLAVHQAEEYESFLNVLRVLFTELNELGVALP